MWQEGTYAHQSTRLVNWCLTALSAQTGWEGRRPRRMGDRPPKYGAGHTNIDARPSFCFVHMILRYNAVIPFHPSVTMPAVYWTDACTVKQRGSQVLQLESVNAYFLRLGPPDSLWVGATACRWHCFVTCLTHVWPGRDLYMDGHPHTTKTYRLCLHWSVYRLRPGVSYGWPRDLTNTSAEPASQLPWWANPSSVSI